MKERLSKSIKRLEKLDPNQKKKWKKSNIKN